MNIKSLLLTACTCGILLCGCSDDKPKYGAPANIKVFGIGGRTDLDSNVRLGLFVDSPVNADNVSMTVTDRGFAAPDNDIRWGYDQSRASRFFVYAPYDATYKGQDFVAVTIPEDQSTVEKMLKGNIMTAMTSADPSTLGVTMSLTHAMTAMTLQFDNRTGSKIKKVTVQGVMTVGRLNFVTGTLVATSGKQVITPLRSPVDDNIFSFIYLPQDVTPVINVTLATGKQMSFTFDSYCHTYPGSILRMEIELNENTPAYSILAMNGVTLTQWTSSGAPDFPESTPYIDLAGLKDVEPDKNDNGFFAAYLNKVTVTAVDNNTPELLGVVLEDSSKAIHVWCHQFVGLEVGNTISGPILGLMNKPSADEFHISHFYIDYATVGKNGVLPLTEGRFDALADNIGKWEYRRMLFKNVSLTEQFRNGRALFEQNGTEIQVMCQDADVILAEGATGDLIGFPIRSGSDIYIRVYDKSAFSTFGKSDSDIPLTRAQELGLYDLSSPDTAVYSMPGADIQYSVRVYQDGRTMQITDMQRGESHLFFVRTNEFPVTGHEYDVRHVLQFGQSPNTGSEMRMECVKVDGNRAWLIDRLSDSGLVLAL